MFPMAGWCAGDRGAARTWRPSTRWWSGRWPRRGWASASLSGVAATAGPGLVGGVMVGLAFAKAMALALQLDLPLIAVNHLEGHALSVAPDRGLPLPLPARFW